MIFKKSGIFNLNVPTYEIFGDMKDDPNRSYIHIFPVIHEADIKQAYFNLTYRNIFIEEKMKYLADYSFVIPCIQDISYMKLFKTEK